MERLLSLLPKGQSIILRYGCSAILVAIFFVFQVDGSPYTGPNSFIYFIPPILLSAIIFDRGSGIVATVLSMTLVGLRLDWSLGPAKHVAALTLFAVVALFVVIVGESMRKALERLAEAHSELQVLLDEQGHRIKNDLAISSSLIALQARSQPDPAVQSALESAVTRLHVIARSYDHLRVSAEEDQVTDMQEYLTEVCWKLGETLRGIRPIAVIVNAESVLVDARKANRIGLLVNELVTNAMKYAFPNEMGGTISVRLGQGANGLKLVVEDDGVGFPSEPHGGLGTRLTELLVQQLGGSITRKELDPGCQITINVPTEARRL